ncbi:MAG: M48 family peptidase, partial [Gammaproteobacteria bacterium]
MDFDPSLATAQYIDALGDPALAKAAAYTTGGHWLLLWGLVVSALMTWGFVRTGLLYRMEQRLMLRGPFLRSVLVAGGFLLLSALVELPWTL